MKKGISFALAALMAVSLMACGGGAAKSTTAAGTEKQTEQASEKATEKAGETEAAKEQSKGEAKTIGVSLLNSTHVFYNSIESAMEEQAKEYGWTLDVQDAAGDANKQLGQVQDFITKKVDAIVIAPTNSAGSKSMIDLADKAGIPVFTMDIASDGKPVTHVATDNKKGGQLAAEYVVNNILTDKKGNAAVITYSEIESCVDREKGFTDYLKENAPDIKIVDVQNYSGDQQKAADVMQNML